MPSGKPTLKLGESWVVEGDDDSQEYEPEDDEDLSVISSNSPPRRPTRNTNRSPEPQFVMPPLDNDTLAASWAESSSKNPAGRNDARLTEGRRSSRLAADGTLRRRYGPQVKDQKRTSNKDDSRSTSSRSRGVGTYQNFFDIIMEHATSILSWAVEVLGGALRVLKTPISYILAIWLLFGISVIVRNLVTTSIYASLSPVCRVPGVSILNLPFCPAYRVDTRHGDPPNVEFDQLMEVQSKFEEVLQDTAGNVALPMDMKRGEASIRDLRQIVRYSQLRSK